MTTVYSANRIFLALWLPWLASERLIRDGAASSDVPLATVERHANAMRLVHIGKHAARLGLNSGTTLADARALLPELVVHDDAPDEDRALLEWLADGCDRYTPMVAIHGKDGLVLDLTGCAPVPHAAKDLAARLAQLELTVQQGIGTTPEMAMARARYGNVEIASLPVSALNIVPEVQLALQRAGLKTVGAVAKRPRGALTTRFGAGLLDGLLRVTGEQDSRITPRRLPPLIFALRRFAEPVARLDDVLSILRELMIETCTDLERRGQGARSLRATLFRSDGDVRSLAVETGRPVRDPKAIAKLFDERIDALADPLDPGFGFDAVRLDIAAAEPLESISPKLIGTCESSESTDALVDRLSTRLGSPRVTRLATAGTHIPEQAQLALSAAEPHKSDAFPNPEDAEPPLRPFHLFDPPQRIEMLAIDADGSPVEFRWHRRIHPVTRVEGPERIAAQWWTRLGGERPNKGGMTRDYFRVEGKGGQRFWLLSHGLRGVEKVEPYWFLHGMFP